MGKGTAEEQPLKGSFDLDRRLHPFSTPFPIFKVINHFGNPGIMLISHRCSYCSL